MIINAHAHIICKEIYSDAFWEGYGSALGKAIGMPYETVMKEIIPQVWGSNAAAYVGVMDDAGIDKVVINHPDYGLSRMGEANWSIEKINEWYVKQIAEFPDKFVYIAGIDPRRSNALELLDKAANKWNVNAVKIYAPCGFYPDENKFDSFYKKCVELGFTLHSHTAALTHPMAENKYANPIYLDSVAAKFPDLKILIVHFGGSATTWSLTVMEMMNGRANLFTEFSAHQPAAVGMPEYWLKLLRAMLDTPAFFGPPIADRIMFGSDWPYLAAVLDEKSWVEWLKTIPEKAKEYGLTFTKEEIDKILGGNAKNFFNL